MRLAILILALSAASAAAAGDRYGPGPSQGAATAAPVAWSGPVLTWSRKTQPSPDRPAPGPRRLPDGLYAGPGAPSTQLLAKAAPPPLPQALAPQAPAALPDSLYARPAAQPAAAPVANPYASSTPRFYSVYREYGGQPDPIALPPPGVTWAARPEASLIEPLDPPKKKKKGDRAASEEDGDWGASADDDLMDEPS